MRPGRARPPPLLFVHGNGDNAAVWTPQLWRFESNGWPRERLFALNVPYPLAPDDDTVAQPERSTSAENLQLLTHAVDDVLQRTGAPQLVLMASSRGGLTVRHYLGNDLANHPVNNLAHASHATKVSHAILGSTPNHGVYVNPHQRLGHEFNGAGHFMKRLNQPHGPLGLETAPGVRWLTLRSDHQDKYAQPDGAALGHPGQPTHVGFDGPALKGADNAVIAGADHRETSLGPEAFALAFAFITGQAPHCAGIAPERSVVLNGQVNAPTSHLALVGAHVEVHATHFETGQRVGPCAHRQTVGADGLWGPFTATAGTPYEFVITATGRATTHIYRSPFPRGSHLVNLQAEPLPSPQAPASVTFNRPRGYFGVPRDLITFEGAKPPVGVPSVSALTLAVPEPTSRSVVAAFNGERIVGRSWPAHPSHQVVLELHY
jgi:triacylglycerol lipase